MRAYPKLLVYWCKKGVALSPFEANMNNLKVLSLLAAELLCREERETCLFGPKDHDMPFMAQGRPTTGTVLHRDFAAESLGTLAENLAPHNALTSASSHIREKFSGGGGLG